MTENIYLVCKQNFDVELNADSFEEKSGAINRKIAKIVELL